MCVPTFLYGCMPISRNFKLKLPRLITISVSPCTSFYTIYMLILLFGAWEFIDA